MNSIVSIVVPVYKAENSLVFCVNSILEQSYTKIEIILVDDGSPDNSGSLCDALACKDSRIQVHHKKNEGVSSARNTGIELAQGKYVLFVDSDDYVETTYVEKMLLMAETHPEEGNVWCNIQTVTGYKHENPVANVEVTEEFLRYTKQEIMTLHEMWLDASPCNKLYSRKVLLENNIEFKNGLSLGEDLLFNLQYLDVVENKKIFIIGKPLYNYVRNGAESLDNGYKENLQEIYVEINRTIKYYLEKWRVDDKQMKLFYNSRFYLMEKVLLNTMICPELKLKEKIISNTKFLKSEVFREAIGSCICYIHPAYRFAYAIGSYRLVRVLDYIYKMKQKK